MSQKEREILMVEDEIMSFISAIIGKNSLNAIRYSEDLICFVVKTFDYTWATQWFDSIWFATQWLDSTLLHDPPEHVGKHWRRIRLCHIEQPASIRQTEYNACNAL